MTMELTTTPSQGMSMINPHMSQTLLLQPKSSFLLVWCSESSHSHNAAKFTKKELVCQKCQDPSLVYSQILSPMSLIQTSQTNCYCFDTIMKLSLATIFFFRIILSHHAIKFFIQWCPGGSMQGMATTTQILSSLFMPSFEGQC